ncbi:proline racemase family protein [Natronorarus salvus]|uniref:proline racemase family protein n=1 Tax=Natronorarus salvus TaxID=3117733 RepID=UPI002F264525
MDWEPPGEWERIETIESHTGGEPFRIVPDGYPTIPGETMAEKRAYAHEHHDHLRTALVWEPRGHADMYAGVLTDPVADGSDLGVLFLHNEGYSTMCGHGIVALGTALPELGLVDLDPAEPELRIDTPAGTVLARSEFEGGRVRRVAFENVPSYVVARDRTIDVEGIGPVRYDLAFGGAFYAYCDAEEAGVSLDPSGIDGAIDHGRAIKRAVVAETSLEHPDEQLAFLYGVIFTGPAEDEAADLRNVCVFADGEVDRSPTGTGVSGHLALRAEEIGERELVVESVVGSTFTGRIARKTTVDGRETVVPVVEGSAHTLGRAEFWIDPEDPLGEGFFLR